MILYLWLGSVEYDFHRKDRTWLLDPVAFGKPSAIAVPTTNQHVAAIVQYVSKTHVKVSVACGRHTHESIVQGGLMVDMSHGMNNVTVNETDQTVTVQGGATIGKVDSVCSQYGYIIPMGRVGSTGCIGQMLSTGAHGYCERMYGLGIDCLISAVVVTSTYEIITCNKDENTELFWAIRGGGFNFGVVCEMTFKPHIAPNKGQFYAGSYVYLTTGILGMPTRKDVMQHILECMDHTRPVEYSFSATMIAGSINPVIITHYWFGGSHEEGKQYIQSSGKKIGVCVSNTMGVHDYWNGIQKWAQGPKVRCIVLLYLVVVVVGVVVVV